MAIKKDFEAQYVRIGNDFLNFGLDEQDNTTKYINNPINGNVEKLHEIEGYKNYEFSISGINGQGQDNIKKYPKLIKMWDNWHLNSLNAGSLKQAAMVDEYFAQTDKRYDYQEAKDFLKENNAYSEFDEDGNEVKYGYNWILNPLPNAIYDFAKELIEKHNEYSNKIYQLLDDNPMKYGRYSDFMSRKNIASSLFFDSKDKKIKFFNGFDERNTSILQAVSPAVQQELKILVLERQEFVADMLKKIPEVALKNANEHFYSANKEEKPALKETVKVENVQQMKI